MGKAMLSSLNRQKLNATNEKKSMQMKVNSIEADITRLQEASMAMSNEISNFTTISGSIQNLTMDESRWKGMKMSEFMQRYDEYKSNINSLLTEIKERKDQLDDEISQALLTKSIYMDSIAGYSNQITRLNAEIEEVKRSEE